MLYKWCFKIFKELLTTMMTILLITLTVSSNRLHVLTFSNLSVTSPMSQLILQPFRRFTYVTAHSPTLPLLHLRRSSFSNPSFATPTSQALHLRHLASHPWCQCYRIYKFSASLRTKLCIYVTVTYVSTVYTYVALAHSTCFGKRATERKGFC